MFKKLFDNIGSKIMGVVKFYFYANAVVVAALVLIITVVAMSEDFAAGMLTLVLSAIIGAIYLLFVYLGMLCMYGFGELVQCNIEQRNILRTMGGKEPTFAHRIDETRFEEPKREPERKRTVSSKPVVTDWTPATTSPVVRTTSMDAGLRKNVCPHCGARQPEGTEQCKYCGTAMK